MEPTQALSDLSAGSSNGASNDERRPRKAKRSSGAPKPSEGARFFLAAGEMGKADSLPALGEEFPDGDKALVASFQRNLPFYRVETWKAHAEKKGRNMVLRPHN